MPGGKPSNDSRCNSQDLVVVLPSLPLGCGQTLPNTLINRAGTHRWLVDPTLPWEGSKFIRTVKYAVSVTKPLKTRLVCMYCTQFDEIPVHTITPTVQRHVHGSASGNVLIRQLTHGIARIVNAAYHRTISVLDLKWRSNQQKAFLHPTRTTDILITTLAWNVKLQQVEHDLRVHRPLDYLLDGLSERDTGVAGADSSKRRKVSIDTHSLLKSRFLSRFAASMTSHSHLPKLSYVLWQRLVTATDAMRSVFDEIQ